jgi:Carboxypeptidase regulatory-like domain
MERVFNFFPMKAGGRQFALIVFLASCFFCPCTGWSWEIVGSVKDDAGNPIAGIAVSGYPTADNTNGIAKAVTAEDGGFRLAAFDGSWDVSISSDALVWRGYRSGVSSKQSIIVSGADEHVDLVCLKVVFTTRLSGRLIDEQGVPLTNAAISAIALDSSYWAATKTDESGRFDLPLFGDFWDLEMNAGDRPGSPERLVPRIILRTVDGVDQTNSLFVARIPTAEVVVSVEDASGSNISNLLLLGVGAVGAITTMGDTNYVVSNPSMDSSGRLIFHLTEGTWRLNADGFSTDSGVPIAIPDRTITVTGARQDVSWVARNPTNHLRGRVVDGLGTPIGDVRILANSLLSDGLRRNGPWAPIRGTTARAWTRTGADGGFDLTVFGGLWNLSADRPVADGPDISLRDVAVIDGLDRTNVQLVVQPFTADISGSVTDTSGRPVDPFFVTASTKIGEQVFSTSGYTDKQGKFRLPAFNADWSVSGQFPPPSLGASWIVPPTLVRVSGTNAVVQLVAETLTVAARLRGRVVDSAGATVSGLYLHASRSDGKFRVDTKTGYGGAFDLGVGGGSWAISTDSFQDGNWFYIGPRISIGVEDGVDQTNLLLVAQRTAGQITGTVIDTDGRGVAGLSVSASTDLQGTSYFANGETDQEGRFRIDIMDANWEVRVGDHVLNALAFQSLAARTVTVAGANEALDFVAQRIIGDGRLLTFISPIRLPDGAFQLRAASQTARRYRIEASPDLRDWTAVSTNDTEMGSFIFTDHQSASTPRRFYRAALME